jgi:hypothetical protein
VTDLVSYYVETTTSRGPTVLVRRRLDPEYGGRVDESYSPSKDIWRPHKRLRKYESGRADYDYYGINPDEAERVAAWLREVVEVGRDNASKPPVLGEWSVGYAWLVTVKGPLPEETVENALTRLGMARRAYLGPMERDLGLKVLRSDMSCRWNFELYRASTSRWFFRLLYLRLTPDERVIESLREQVYALGLEIVEEQVAIQDSWPYSDRAMKQSRPDADWLLVLWFQGRMTERMLRELHERLTLTAETGGDLDETWKLEWGARFLPNDGRFRAQLRLRREFDDEDQWRFEIGVEGQRPPEETIDRWRAEIMAAATEVGLAYEKDWLRPRPMPQHRTQPQPRPVRTSAQVHVLYRAYLDGQFTAEALDEFRDALGIGRRGRLDDDTEQFFGERYLREEENRLVRLMLARTFDGDWYLSLSYQGDLPDQATVDQVARDIRAAAAQAGLTVGREQHNPPGGGSS